MMCFNLYIFLVIHSALLIFFISTQRINVDHKTVHQNIKKENAAASIVKKEVTHEINKIFVR